MRFIEVKSVAGFTVSFNVALIVCIEDVTEGSLLRAAHGFECRSTESRESLTKRLNGSLAVQRF